MTATSSSYVSTKSVSSLLRNCGIKTGYRRSRNGFVDANRQPFSGPGVSIRRDDSAGVVHVFGIADPTGEQQPPAELMDAIAEALNAVSFAYRRSDFAFDIADADQRRGEA